MERARRIIDKAVEVLTRGSRAREQQRQQFEAARAHIASRQQIVEGMGFVMYRGLFVEKGMEGTVGD